MQNEIKRELKRARIAFHEALREHGRNDNEESRKALDVAGRFLASAAEEYLGL